MEHSAAYLFLSVWLRNRLLVIRYFELLKLLSTLENQGRISIEECNELLSLAEHLKTYDLTITE
jgi:hypothetical protein